MQQNEDWYLHELSRSPFRTTQTGDSVCAIGATFSWCDGVRSADWSASVERDAENVLDLGHPLQVAVMLEELAGKLRKNFGRVETRLDDFNEFMK